MPNEETEHDNDKVQCCGGEAHSREGTETCGCRLGQDCGCRIYEQAKERLEAKTLTRRYDFLFNISEAGGLMGSKYKGTSGSGVLLLEAVDGRADVNLKDRPLQLTGTVTQATYADGRAIEPYSLDSLKFGPRRVQYDGKKTIELTGGSWKAELDLDLSDDLNVVTVRARGTGTGLAKFAVNNIQIEARGRVN